MKKQTLKSKVLLLTFVSLLFSFFSFKAQPCFSILNQFSCQIEVTWETVDGSHNLIAGATNVTIGGGGGTLQITGAACASAADIHVLLVLVNGSSANMIQSVNGIVLQPPHTQEIGTHGATCGGGTWDVNWTSGNPVVIQP